MAKKQEKRPLAKPGMTIDQCVDAIFSSKMFLRLKLLVPDPRELERIQATLAGDIRDTLQMYAATKVRERLGSQSGT